MSSSSNDIPPRDYLKPKRGLRGVNEALDSLKESQPGTHCLLVYPDLMTLRALYSNYTKILLEERNEMVLILPYYDTVDMVRSVLSGRYNFEDENDNDNDNNRDNSPIIFAKDYRIDVSKYEKNGSLIIMDSLKGHFPSEQQNNISSVNNGGLDFMSFLDVLLKQVEKQRKSGLTVLSDLGSFHHHHNQGSHKLIKYEKSLSKAYDGMNLKGYCLYHQKDFEGHFNQKQQAELLDCHSRSIMLVDA